MGTPLGDFIRAKRDRTQPESLGLPDHGRRRSPGLRRSDLAARAGISVEYLTRIEQGRDRNPSIAVVNAIADGLSLDQAERQHLRYLTKITGGACVGHLRGAEPNREIRPSTRQTLELMEPGLAVVMNRLGDILAYTSSYRAVLGGIGLLDIEQPNLTRYVFTDPRSRTAFPDWDDIADEQAFDLWLGPSIENVDWFVNELAPVACEDFARRLNQHQVPARGVLRLRPSTGPELRLTRETMELADMSQQLVVLLPADEETAHAIEQLIRPSRGGLRVIS
ncbi:MAG TPA: helix-turn-helix transcriptional regulator [Pseudonocardiaceae bacterium]